MRIIQNSPQLIKELYKILISQKSLIILGILIIISAQLHLGKMHLYSVGEGYLSRFYREAKGLTYGAELEKIYGNYTKGNSNQNELNAILRSKLDYLKKQQEAGYNVQVIAPFEYEEFFGNNQKNNRITLLIIDIIAVIFVLAGFTKYEKNRGMHPLIRASCNRRSWLTTKWLASMIVIAVYIIINYSIYYVRLLGLYRLPELTVRVKSLEIFSWLPINPTVIGLIVIGVVIRIILVIVITGIVRCAYEK